MKKRIALAIILCLGLLAGYAKVLIYGDTRTQVDIHHSIIPEIIGHNPQIVFHTGDLNTHGKAQSEYDEFLLIISPIKAPFYPAKGNHEKDTQLFLANFPILQGNTYYSVEHDSLLFIVLDTSISLRPTSAQHDWLLQKLESTSLPIIVIQHHPILTSGHHGDELWLSSFLPAMFQQYNVKAVFCGHEHNYEHLYHVGIHYVVTGGGGAPLRDLKEKSPHSLKFEKIHHYTVLERNGNILNLEVYDLEGNLIDSFSLE